MSIAASMISSVSTTPVTATALAPETRLRITARGRRVLAALIALPIVAALGTAALLGGGAAIAGADSSTTSFEYVTVTGGQTLWGIAETLAPEADPRDVIAEIMSLNQLTESSVQPGQRIAIPTHLAD
ncbi:LysM peptidoglycan-binding domain-containing protein [Herbiconiux moechotypicola]|uniref:LysM domain-containing protein n=1 Tax=Herbiconiux moechotypicola TaxID=637393 RepID=A0ABP5QE77_9MICO|nr:LysM peptidoglycan-binding domain-containing protein [Herbiconiux moechotypicola]MCS5729893.1 LysM peptidoglycan-binding domain-containing protein [Herbiconiux moechotypicola]